MPPKIVKAQLRREQQDAAPPRGRAARRGAGGATTPPPEQEKSSTADSNLLRLQFNPETLRIATTTSVQQKNQRNPSSQYVDHIEAVLTVQLVFDTTDSGQDVTAQTRRIRAWMNPYEDREQRGAERGPKRAPPRVSFEWGEFKFTGFIASFEETLDFFSDQGRPLRATVALTMNQSTAEFAPGSDAQPSSTSTPLAEEAGASAGPAPPPSAPPAAAPPTPAPRPTELPGAPSFGLELDLGLPGLSLRASRPLLNLIFEEEA